MHPGFAMAKTDCAGGAAMVEPGVSNKANHRIIDGELRRKRWAAYFTPGRSYQGHEEVKLML